MLRLWVEHFSYKNITNVEISECRVFVKMEEIEHCTVIKRFKRCFVAKRNLSQIGKRSR